jgi:hypothetical protein
MALFRHSPSRCWSRRKRRPPTKPSSSKAGASRDDCLGTNGSGGASCGSSYKDFMLVPEDCPERLHGGRKREVNSANGSPLLQAHGYCLLSRFSQFDSFVAGSERSRSAKADQAIQHTNASVQQGALERRFSTSCVAGSNHDGTQAKSPP